MATPPDRRATAFLATSVPENYQRRLAPVIFEPWAEVLLETAGARPGDRVLDVATGTGVVARLAARHAGPGGEVLATDVSEVMLAHAATLPAADGSAPVAYRQSAATELHVPDGAFDVALCQQGLPFFSDRPGALAEMRRALRPGGTAAVSVWVAGHRLEPFDDYAESLRELGIDPPFFGAFDTSTFVMSADEVEQLLVGAGFEDVAVSVVELTVAWPSAEDAANGILGTPFGPALAQLPPERRAALDAELARRFATPSGEPVRRTTVAVVARGTAAAAA